MPELPEVETVCRGLRPALEGRRIERAIIRRKDLRKPFPAGLAAKLKDATVERVYRRAKYILCRLDNNFVLVIHLGMSGRVRVMRHAGEAMVHDHFILHTDRGDSIVLNDPRRFGLVDLVAAEDLDAHSLFRNLGPEPLDKGFDEGILGDSLRGKRVSIKTAIMDQGIVVGVGNIYASESLFLAGIDPAMEAGSVSRRKLARLVIAIRTVLQKAIDAGGSTLRDHRQTSGEMGYFQYSFAVYDREGQACPGCRCDISKTGGVKKIIQGGRSTFFCPRKQT